MSRNELSYRFLFAGGGTGGHLYPAIAVASKIMELNPDSIILFVGTKGKIESEVVPKLGFDFKTIWISGFSRKLNFKNLIFPIKLIVSMIQSFFLNMKFKPNVAIGTGAYVSGPAIWGASATGAKIMLLEQNSYPGLTNRLLERKADQIHISFEESKKYFRKTEKLTLSGNPIRSEIKLIDKIEAKRALGFNSDGMTLFVVGGSLGAQSINEQIEKNIDVFKELGLQIIWQTGERYYDQYRKYDSPNILIKKYIDDIAIAYSAADLVVARAGATTIAEVSALGLPVLFIPSPNVAADHQYKNAKAITDADAAELIKDNELNKKFKSALVDLLNNPNKLERMKANIKLFSKPDAAEVIAQSAINLAEKKK